MEAIQNKRRINTLLYILVPFLLLLAGAFPLPSLAVTIGFIGVGVSLYYFKESNHKMIYFLFVVSIVQNAFAIYLMGALNISIAYEVQYYKELFLISIVAYLLLFRNSIKMKLLKVDFAAYVFLAYILCVSFWFGDADMFAKIASLRQVLLPFLFYILGRHILITEDNLKVLIRKVVTFGCVVVAFGLYESYISPGFWENIGIFEFFLEKRGREELVMVNGIPSNFYTSDFVQYTGAMMRRMASFVANPPVLAHILGFISTLALFNKKLKKFGFLWFLFLSVGVLLTLGKGGVITLGIGLWFYLIFEKRRFFLAYTLACLGIAGAALYINKVIKQGLSAVDHIFGFLNSIEIGLSKPFGAGLGMVGNLAEVHNDSVTVSEGGGAESFLGLVAGQFGLVGFVVFCLFFLFAMYSLWVLIKTYKRGTFLHRTTCATLAIVIAMFLTAFLTESAISYTSSGLPLILVGSLITNAQKNPQDR